MMLVRASARRSEKTTTVAFSSPLPSAAETAAEASLRATLAAGNPWSVNALVTNFRLTRPEATKLRERVLAESNGHPSGDGPDTTTTEGN